MTAMPLALPRAIALSALCIVSAWSGAVAQGLGPAAPAVLYPVRPEVASPERVAPSPQAGDTFCCQTKHFWVAAGEILAVEMVQNYFNHHVADDTTAVLSWDSWKRNVQLGLEWDPNNLQTNVFAHPYNGAIFFNAGRSNGYNFWESQAFAFAGSMMWEMFGENNRGAINDWANTSLGGIAIGEALHRAAIMVRDNEARGAGRAFSELAGFLIDPFGGFSRALRGEFSKYGPNPVDRFPTRWASSVTLGYRAVSEGRITDAEAATGYFEFRANYGDPMQDYARPFDAFQMNLQLNKSDASPIGLFQVHGSLWGNTVGDPDGKTRHVFAVDQLYDYANTNAYEIGGVAYGVGMRSRWRLSESMALNTLLQPNVIVMSAISSEYAGFTGRDYDFGPGLGLRAIVGLNGGGFRGEVGYRAFASHVMNGAKGNQIAHFVFLRAGYRIWRSVGINADYLLHLRDSFYRDYPDVHRRAPEFRIGGQILFGDAGGWSR
jgi:hypothetical protein